MEYGNGTKRVYTADVIVEEKGMVLLIKRSERSNAFPNFYAIPGGKVDSGESVEEAAVREAKEEIGVEVKLIGKLGVYSEPGRDPRGNYVSTVFIGEIMGDQKPVAGDDAKSYEWVDVYKAARELNMAFDHNRILSDYLDFRKARGLA
jgi:8-oxo-dGTP diphosphatase